MSTRDWVHFLWLSAGSSAPPPTPPLSFLIYKTGTLILPTQVTVKTRLSEFWKSPANGQTLAIRGHWRQDRERPHLQALEVESRQEDQEMGQKAYNTYASQVTTQAGQGHRTGCHPEGTWDDKWRWPVSALADHSMETKLKDIWSVGRRQMKLTGPFLLWPPHSLAVQRLHELKQATGRGWLLTVLVT